MTERLEEWHEGVCQWKATSGMRSLRSLVEALSSAGGNKFDMKQALGWEEKRRI